jgi:DNA-directed RNA polymerase subunit RPC12/RpoP
MALRRQTETAPEAGTAVAERRAREFDVELPVGHLDDDGRLHRTATLRKMTGREESLLADRKLRQNGGKLVTELLANCVLALGDVRPVTRDTIARLSSPDRNFLLLELRKITFGDTMETVYECPACGETTQSLQDLADLEVRRVDGDGTTDIVVELDDGYEDREGELYTTMVFRLPTGVDEERIAGTVKSNASEGMSALLTRCLVAVGDMPQPRREALGSKLLSDLTMGDRARIDRAFRADIPGVDLMREIECEHCGRKVERTLDLSSFFSLR